MKAIYLGILFWVAFHFSAKSQYDPAAGKPGSLAMAQDSSAFKNWAFKCELSIGWMDISDSSFGKADVGTKTDALGRPDNFVVSLGDAGTATLQFPYPIVNGQGPDFAVFENSFRDDYLELAFVEVSTDGKRFVRFPAISLVDTSNQIGPFGTMNCTKINNLAGKHRGGFGTPFDLEQLKDSAGINVDSINYVRLVDVIGAISPEQYASRDSRGHLINDPWPTQFASSGFDLDAVGVINQHASSGIEEKPSLSVYPNPCISCGQITIPNFKQNTNLSLFDAAGKEMVFVQKGISLEIELLPSGVYTLIAQNNETTTVTQLYIQN